LKTGQPRSTVAPARVAIHPSQFPEAVRLDLLESLRSRKINHKFHYDSLKQSQKWLGLHEAYAPSLTDPDCATVYHQGFAEVADTLKHSDVHLVGLGCGGGQKDVALLKLLQDRGKGVLYTPCDVGLSMVLTARQAALSLMPGLPCFPLVCDLATTDDLPAVLNGLTGAKENAGPARLFTFFGMIPNFEPGSILPKLEALIGPDDQLLLSANLAPGADYITGVERVLPLYDNALTQEWLMLFLLDLGVELEDGELSFKIEEDLAPPHLRRIAAYFCFAGDRLVAVDSHRFEFHAGESVRLFFSYRHTAALVRQVLGQHHFVVLKQWITPSQEEGVFLVTKAQ
jgi:uncharacterized SAM-dependent methyltransferase